MIEFKGKVQDFGGSKYIHIPKYFVDEENLEKGEKVKINIKKTDEGD